MSLTSYCCWIALTVICNIMFLHHTVINTCLYGRRVVFGTYFILGSHYIRKFLSNFFSFLLLLILTVYFLRFPYKHRAIQFFRYTCLHIYNLLHSSWKNLSWFIFMLFPDSFVFFISLTLLRNERKLQ